MSTFYYPNNEVLPRWTTPESGGSWLKPLLATVALLAAAVLAWLYWPDSDIERRAKAATVFILVEGRDSNGRSVGACSGSGVLISPKGYILTNRHVVTVAEKSAKSKIIVLVNSGTPQQKEFSDVSIADKSKEPWLLDSFETIRNDWCVLQISQKEPFDYLSLSDKKSFKEKESLCAYGFPGGQETSTSSHSAPEVKVSMGHITRLGTGKGNSTVCLSHDALIDHGSSGGPLLQDGKIVGIHTSGISFQGEKRAIPAYLLKESVFDKYGK